MMKTGRLHVTVKKTVREDRGPGCIRGISGKGVTPRYAWGETGASGEGTLGVMKDKFDLVTEAWGRHAGAPSTPPNTPQTHHNRFPSGGYGVSLALFVPIQEPIKKSEYTGIYAQSHQNPKTRRRHQHRRGQRRPAKTARVTVDSTRKKAAGEITRTPMIEAPFVAMWEAADLLANTQTELRQQDILTAVEVMQSMMIEDDY